MCSRNSCPSARWNSMRLQTRAAQQAVLAHRTGRVALIKPSTCAATLPHDAAGSGKSKPPKANMSHSGPSAFPGASASKRACLPQQPRARCSQCCTQRLDSRMHSKGSLTLCPELQQATPHAWPAACCLGRSSGAAPLPAGFHPLQSPAAPRLIARDCIGSAAISSTWPLNPGILASLACLCLGLATQADAAHLLM